MDLIEIQERLKSDIDEHCVRKYSDGHRGHLGASQIGDPCPRKLWYQFRWVKAENFDARMLRLFNRGHREEERFIELLRGIGCEVRDVNPDTGDQYRVSAHHGHFGGSEDSRVLLPERYNITEWLLAEFKTHNLNRWELLKKKGFRKELSTEKHWCQMCTYGNLDGFKYGLYLTVCKNDDNLHLEVVDIDISLGEKMVEKGGKIIFSRVAPPKLSMTSTHYKCKNCHFSEICHGSAIPEVNCRSCEFAEPTENKRWGCHGYGQLIPDEVIPVGCPNWKPCTRLES